ncbi:MAG: WbqC family protein [Ferrovum sp.]|nr:WbqC family protein [Ferrovum sp.]NDU86648.1 WbqC family protein [Ferrovum sp.]
MQPYFFPYLGHFSLIAAVDEWLVFDITQYTPKTWMNRNRILHPNQGWQYVSIPLANGSISIKTYEAKILDPVEARKNVLGKLSHYKRKAPYYDAVLNLIDETFDDGDDSLVRLDVRGLAAVCRYLDISFHYRICSEMNLDLPAALDPGEWALEICSRLGAGAYLNPSSGKALFNQTRFAERGIDLLFAQPTEFSYRPMGYHYEPYLSMLDLLMWNSPDVVARAADEQVIIEMALGNE